MTACAPMARADSDVNGLMRMVTTSPTPISVSRQSLSDPLYLLPGAHDGAGQVVTQVLARPHQTVASVIDSGARAARPSKRI
jgi:hypothetical protein